MGSERVQFFAVANCDGFKPLDLDGKLVDDAPGNDLLPRDPKPGLLVVRLPKEELNVEKVAEAAALKDLHLQAWQHGVLSLNRSRLRSCFESTDEATLGLVDAVVEQRLEVAAKGRKLLDLQVLPSL